MGFSDEQDTLWEFANEEFVGQLANSLLKKLKYLVPFSEKNFSGSRFQYLYLAIKNLEKFTSTFQNQDEDILEVEKKPRPRRTTSPNKNSKITISNTSETSEMDTKVAFDRNGKEE